jgi:hypothetical protein
MVSTPELTVVVSTDTVDLVCFRFFFFASAVWVAAIVATAQEAGTFTVACRICRDNDLGRCPMRCGRSLIVTPHHRVGDVFIDGRWWCCLYVRSVADLVVALVLVVQRCGAPVDAFAMLREQDMTAQ